jgi:23S rRNA (adenine2503-C2)-methyltransferase
MSAEKLNIRNLTFEELKTAVVALGLPAFRTQQIYEWLWKKNVGTFDDMKNLGKGAIDALNELYFIDRISTKEIQTSNDKTLKCAFETYDHKIVEGVLIPTATRMTACISSQVGCSLSCAFCATGKLKLLRNLTPGEIVDQVIELRNLALEKYGIALSNIVFMGMGEPLLNYKNVIQSIEIMSAERGLFISPRRITLSTAGIAKMIKKLGDEEVRFNLALSLHAATDAKRSKVMEINDSNDLESLRDALSYFHEKTQSRITFEYILFKDFNDSLSDAADLAKFSRCVPCKINLIEYNPIGDPFFEKASFDNTQAFSEFLEEKNMIVNVRRSRGKDIDAACGQLANKNKMVLKAEQK